MAQDMNEEHGGNIRTTLRKFGYAAAVLSGSAAAVYSLTNALQRHDLSTLWKLDKRAAPPLSIQRELLHGSQEESLFDSDDSDDDKARRHKQQELQDPRDMPGEDEHSMLEAKLHRAMRRGNMQLVQALAKRMERLRNKYEQRRDMQGVNPGRMTKGAGLRPKRRRSDDDGLCRASETGLKSGETMMPISKKKCGSSTQYSSSALPWDFDGDAYTKRRRKPERARSYDAPESAERVLHDDFDEAQIEDMQQAAPSSGTIRRSQHESRPPSVIGTPSTSSPRAAEECDRLRTRSGTEAIASGSVTEAAKMLMVGDLVQAQCPLSKQWCDATIHAVKARGLVEVRWHNPGFAPDGRRFHPYGDVWAENVRIAYRKKDGYIRATTEQVCRMTGDARISVAADSDSIVMVPDNLQVGDECFARGHMLELRWFKARVLAVRMKTPPIHVEFLATMDGSKMPLLLPEPRKAFVHGRDVCREKPSTLISNSTGTLLDNTSPAPTVDTRPSQPYNTKGPKCSDTYDDDDDAIDEDLMCSICSCPDNEAHMLVCDCKKGFHTYCLSPKLAQVPDGDWKCPSCTAQNPSTG
ncbi:hypothetical protein AB1Y20_001259 [Prymnesium parvum]|uniref:PHD-type domain-containing protein n=1 Tax=Prymnesium parvum TaxID=97485 RepID=A0AB34KBJ3_PRYPA